MIRYHFWTVTCLAAMLWSFHLSLAQSESGNFLS